jgi:hypothetical protein
VTFVFVDMEGSTRIAQELPGTYPDIVGLFQSTLARIVEGCGGVVIDTEGDGRFASSPWSTGPRHHSRPPGPRPRRRDSRDGA